MKDADRVDRPTELALYEGWNIFGLPPDRTELDWLKTLLLFFDGIAMPGRTYWTYREDPVLFGPLADAGMFFSEEQVVTSFQFRQSEKLRLWQAPPGVLHLQSHGQREDEWKSAGPAVHAELERVEVPGHTWPSRLLIYAADHCAILDSQEEGFSGTPVVAELGPDRLSMHSQKYRLIEIDLETVAINLEAVPLDEVLDFKREHGPEFRRYRRHLRQMLMLMSLHPSQTQEQLLSDRREELADLGDQLRRRMRVSFRIKESLPFLLGISGAALSLGSGDLLSGLSGTLGATASLDNGSGSGFGAYSYLFSAHRRWWNR